MTPELWQDLHESFYLVYGPFLVYIILPIFLGAGLVTAGIMITSRFWRKKPQVDATIVNDD